MLYVRVPENGRVSFPSIITLWGGGTLRAINGGGWTAFPCVPLHFNHCVCCLNFNKVPVSVLLLFFSGMAGKSRYRFRLERSNEYRIKQTIKRHYDETTRPVRNDKTAINVLVAISLYHILDTVISHALGLYYSFFSHTIHSNKIKSKATQW